MSNELYNFWVNIIKAQLVGWAFGMVAAGFIIGTMIIHGFSEPASNDALINARTAFYANESEAVREKDPLIELVIRRQQVRIATQFCVNNEGK